MRYGYKAAKEAGLKEIPIERFTREDAERNNIEAKKLDPNYIEKTYEEQVEEMVVKDNVSGGEWDWDILANEYDQEELEDWGVDLPTDWAEETEVEEDEAPEVSDEPPVSKLGEVYQLGRHRVMCGSATDLDHIGKLLDGDEIDLLLTDPPYNVDYEGGTGLKIMNDKMGDDEFRQFLTDANVVVDAYMKPGAAFYIFHADSEGFNFRASVKDTGWMLKQCLIWVKQSMVMGRQDYQWKHD